MLPANPDAPEVIVVGAGLAGLTAARRLGQVGRRVRVLEARDRVGGRTHTVRLPVTGVAVDLGGQWVGPNQPRVMGLIRELGLELQVIFNKGAVMVLPSGLDKASGLSAALDELGLSPHNTVGVGDAENDQAFLSLCECSVAVANALTMLKESVDLVTSGERGAGVTELIDRIIASDLSELESTDGSNARKVG